MRTRERLRRARRLAVKTTPQDEQYLSVADIQNTLLPAVGIGDSLLDTIELALAQATWAEPLPCGDAEVRLITVRSLLQSALEDRNLSRESPDAAPEGER